MKATTKQIPQLRSEVILRDTKGSLFVGPFGLFQVYPSWKYHSKSSRGLGSRNAGCSRGSRDAYCHDVFKWTFCDILFVPVQGASQNIRFHILAALRLLPHRLAGMLRAITPPTPWCVHWGSCHTMLYPGRVGYTAHRAGHTRQERAWRSHRKHCPSGLLTSEEKGISFSREAQGATWCTDGKRRRQRRCDHWGVNLPSGDPVSPET